MQNLFRQQQKVLQQARVVQNQKLKAVRELYEQFVKVSRSDVRVLLLPHRGTHQSRSGALSLSPAEHGGHGEEPGVVPAGGAAGAEEGDGHAAEEDPHGHGGWSQ